MRERIREIVREAVKVLYSQEIETDAVQVQRTRKEFTGDFSVVVFPFTRFSKKKPEDLANDIGVFMKSRLENMSVYNVVKGFLNITFSTEFWIDRLNEIQKVSNPVFSNIDTQKVMIEFSSPNTNKPLHLGHIRNNLIGESLSRILNAAGNKVLKVNLVNDRGIHICKSMQAYLEFDPNGSPEACGIKGDKYVGDLYVKFEQEYRKQIEELVQKGMDEDVARNDAPIMKSAKAMLKRWEAGDKETLDLWNKMNQWVYSGFDQTYAKLDIRFDQIYYESNTYKLGKDIVLKGLEKDVFYKREDGSVWVDLTKDGLDEKILLRADGTSLYMTQDIGTAVERFENHQLDKMIYVVGNEQIYHFQVLKLILKKLGYNWADKIYHMSYGMVELPDGKMKSREGKVVDADDLIDSMVETSSQMAKELGKLEDLPLDIQKQTHEMIALGALKYFILKVDPKKNMVFNPEESIDFNGNTGPFIQYTHARIRSVVQKAQKMNIKVPKQVSDDNVMIEKELDLIRSIDYFEFVVKEASRELDPGMIANYAYDLAKDFNNFYHDYSILKAKDGITLQFRLFLADQVSKTLKHAMGLLGINVPERM
jgi:arginyl-tRNA synthetase